MARNDSAEDIHRFDVQEVTPVDAEQRYMVNVPEFKVTIDCYTPFQERVIDLLNTIVSRLERLADISKGNR